MLTILVDLVGIVIIFRLILLRKQQILLGLKSITGGNNGNLITPCISPNGTLTYVDLTFKPSENKFTVYELGNQISNTTVEPDYWSGENGGKQILEDTSLNFELGRWFGGGNGTENYTKFSIYNMKFYNRSLSPEEIKENYTKTTAYHNN